MGDVSRRRVLSLGRIWSDLVFTGIEDFPALGRERFARDLTVAPGGGAVITAAYLAGLGRPVSLVARLGRDPISLAIEPLLPRPGLDLSLVEHALDAGPQVTVAIAQHDERAFLSRRAGHARPTTLTAALGLPDATHLHIGEYATLHEIPTLIGEAKAAGLTISLDPSWDEALLRDERLLACCHGVDLMLPNQDEACAIAGCYDQAAALDRLARHFPLVALKCGAKGAVVARGRLRIALPAPQVPVVDTTGAGDAFNAGFIDRWLTGAGLHDCLATAIACGSRSVGAAGGTALSLDAALDSV